MLKWPSTQSGLGTEDGLQPGLSRLWPQRLALSAPPAAQPSVSGPPTAKQGPCPHPGGVSAGIGLEQDPAKTL